jgi:hypothetical protein
MSAAKPASAITLRALSGEPLAEEGVRGLVEATARAVAERQGIEVLRVETNSSSITVTLATGRIEAMGFAAELRRLTNNWHQFRSGAPLWREKVT